MDQKVLFTRGKGEGSILGGVVPKDMPDFLDISVAIDPQILPCCSQYGCIAVRVACSTLHMLHIPHDPDTTAETTATSAGGRA